jgi:membrane protein required for colicin V production
MNLLDLGIVILLGLIVLRGYYRGLFQELAVLVGVLGGILAAANYYPVLAAPLGRLIKEAVYARWVAFGIILVGIYWGTRLVAHLLQRLLYRLYLDVFDRLLGASLALVKGALVLGFALMLVSVVMPKGSPLFKESRTAPALIGLAKQALGYLPLDVKKRLQEHWRDWQQPSKEQALRSRGARPWGGRHG